MGRAETYGDHSLWERIVYQDLYRTQSICACVRTGDRSDPTLPTHLPLNQPIPVRFLARPGVQDKGIPPLFADDDGTTVIVRRRIIKRIGELTTEDLVGCPPDAATPQLVRFHIGLHRNCPLPDPLEVITIYHFEYVE